MHKILLIDSNDRVREINAIILSRKFIVIEARDARTGMELMLAHRPSFVIANVDMPGNTSGFIIAPLANRLNIPVILVSRLPLEAHPKKDIERMKGNLFFQKPYAVSDLMSKVSGILQTG